MLCFLPNVVWRIADDFCVFFRSLVRWSTDKFSDFSQGGVVERRQFFMFFPSGVWRSADNFCVFSLAWWGGALNFCVMFPQRGVVER